MKKRKIALVLAALITLSAPLSFGASIKRNLEAYFSGIKIFVDGKQLMIPQRDEPFIYNNTTFVPLRIVTENFGYKVNWNGTTQTISLTPNTDPSSPNVSSLRYQLSTKDAEINTLKFKVQELENQIAMLKNGNYSTSTTTPGYIGSNGKYLITDNLSTEDGMKKYLEKEYEEYDEGDEDFKFDFDVDEKSSYVKITMQSDDFKKGSSDWRDRGNRDFEKYIEDIAEKVADEFDKDVKIYVEDKYDDQVAEFEYDESKDDLESKYEDEIESKLEDDYREYKETGDHSRLRFTFETEDKDNYLKITMKGDFDKTNSNWEYVKEHKQSDFESFILKMCKDVYDDMDDRKDIEVYVRDEDHDAVFDCRFDRGDKDLKNEAWNR